ncbi:hypothetical protein PAMP_001474 [Pampus punctatissimus]
MKSVCAVCVLVVSLQLTAANYVRPPTDVVLHCSNWKNIVKWTYEQPQPGLRFKVDFGSSGINKCTSPLWVESPNLQADVSFLSDPSSDYFLTVTAVIGHDKSSSSKPIIFSYYQNSQASQICSLDLPPVNVTAEPDGKVKLRFTHPWLLSRPKICGVNSELQEEKTHATSISEELPLFEYEVVIINQTQDAPHASECMENVCEDTLPVDAAQDKYCLKITGEVEKVRVQGTQEYCALRNVVDNTYVYILVSLLVLATFSIIVVMVIRKQTRSSTTLPASMTISQQVKQRIIGIVRETVAVPELEPTAPSTHLLEKEEEKESPTSPSFTTSDGQLSVVMSSDDEGLCDVAEVGQQKDEYTQGNKFDETETLSVEETHSSYEKRHVFVELAPGEKAEGYYE